MGYCVSVVIPAVDEHTIENVIESVCETCDRQDIAEFLIVIPGNTPETYRQFLNSVKSKINNVPVVIADQPATGIGDAIYHGFSLAAGTHLISIAADMNNDPKDIARMIEASKTAPREIVTASRRLNRGAFAQYSFVKRICNDLFYLFLKVLFRSSQTDITYLFQCTPASVFKELDFSDDHRAFVLELALLPELDGVRVREIPSSIGRRVEGKSHVRVGYYFGFLKTAIQLFWKRRVRGEAKR